MSADKEYDDLYRKLGQVPPGERRWQAMGPIPIAVPGVARETPKEESNVGWWIAGGVALAALLAAAAWYLSEKADVERIEKEWDAANRLRPPKRGGLRGTLWHLTGGPYRVVNGERLFRDGSHDPGFDFTRVKP